MRRLLVLVMILVAMVVPGMAPAAAQSDTEVLDCLMGLALQRPSIAGPL
jgi:hypothetical protein